MPVVLTVVMALAVAAGCGPAVAARWRQLVDGPAASTESRLLVYPAANATHVSPAAPVTVELVEGRLSLVSLTNPTGTVVRGLFSADQHTWRNVEPLGYHKTYRLAVRGVGDDGKVYDDVRTFTTVKPRNYTQPSLLAYRGECAVIDDSKRCVASVPQRALNGGTFGVGQLIIVVFDKPIRDKATAERTLVVTTYPSVVGAWRWFGDREVRWRPQSYWPAGTTVTVTANVYGRNLGGGLYGRANRSASFTIGRSKILIADSTTHRMKVYLDGVQTTSINGRDVTSGIPISMGKDQREYLPDGGVVDFRTQSGPHVITTKMPVKRMTSASFGITDPASPNYYDVKIKMAMRISVDGEFVHLADWNIPAQGRANTSHGCVNVAPTYIYWLYQTFGPGDVVDVRNTGRALTLSNGGDWVLSWAQWQRGSALT